MNCIIDCWFIFMHYWYVIDIISATCMNLDFPLISFSFFLFIFSLIEIETKLGFNVSYLIKVRTSHRRMRVVRLETTSENRRIVGLHIPNPAVNSVLQGKIFDVGVVKLFLSRLVSNMHIPPPHINTHTHTLNPSFFWCATSRL